MSSKSKITCTEKNVDKSLLTMHNYQYYWGMKMDMPNEYIEIIHNNPQAAIMDMVTTSAPINFELLACNSALKGKSLTDKQRSKVEANFVRAQAYSIHYPQNDEVKTIARTLGKDMEAFIAEKRVIELKTATQQAIDTYNAQAAIITTTTPVMSGYGTLPQYINGQ